MTRHLGRASRLSLVLLAALCSIPLALRAQQAARADAEVLRKGYDTYRSMRDASPYKSASWMYVGPTNVSGRSTDTAVADKNGQRRIYAGYATSGVWKTDDNGATWQAIFDDMPSTSVGDLAVAPSNPDILWVGTGEANIFRASMPGVGIYKSTDAGKTFQHMGLTDTQTIARILVHPTNPDIVYVAASGHEWTDNEMRGVFKTTDGGKTWTKVLYRSPRTGAIDLVMDPRDPNTLYAALWQRVRRKWSDPRVEPGYKEGGILKTTDGGKTWNDVSQGLPAPEFRGRIGIDVSRSNPNVLYAFVDNYEIGVVPKPGTNDAYGRPMPAGKGFIKGADIYRTDDGGKTWRQTSRKTQATIDYLNGHSGTYGWVFGQIRVDPKDEKTIYTMGLGLNVSRDGGQTFSRVTGMHGDHHGLWIDPGNTSILYNNNDGGFYQSEDGGKTWKFAVSAGGAQFYNVTLDSNTPVWAYGSIQDHGSRRGRVDTGKGRGAVPAVDFENAPGGEGSNHAIDPTNPNIVYSHGFYGNFSRTDLGATPPPDPSGRGGGRGRGGTNTPIQPKDPDQELRAQWMAPIIVSPHDGSIIFAGFQSVYRSENRGDSWQKISADLTDNKKEQMGENPTAIPYQTIVALAESPKRKGLLYVGSDDGRLHVTLDTGKEWTELTSKLPVRRWISRVVPSQHDEGTVYITQRGREDDDFGVYIYKSTDNGRTIRSIAGNIPVGPVNVIREDPRNPNILYVGTDFGVYVSTNGGERWEVLGGNLPSNQVSDLQFEPRDQMLVISTYGRGIWALDASSIK
ncbi:MAG: WD40/YVTN/BNR-like repeat-containing protein [Acidobacteriota bacterium]